LAAGWSACFISTMQVVAGRMKIALPADVALDAEVDPRRAGLRTRGASRCQPAWRSAMLPSG
jgi:organic hydroperoxide reductase OsmC/OhrA